MGQGDHREHWYRNHCAVVESLVPVPPQLPPFIIDAGGCGLMVVDCVKHIVYSKLGPNSYHPSSGGFGSDRSEANRSQMKHVHKQPGSRERDRHVQTLTSIVGGGIRTQGFGGSFRVPS